MFLKRKRYAGVMDSSVAAPTPGGRLPKNNVSYEDTVGMLTTLGVVAALLLSMQVGTIYSYVLEDFQTGDMRVALVDNKGFRSFVLSYLEGLGSDFESTVDVGNGRTFDIFEHLRKAPDGTMQERYPQSDFVRDADITYFLIKEDFPVDRATAYLINDNDYLTRSRLFLSITGGTGSTLLIGALIVATGVYIALCLSSCYEESIKGNHKPMEAFNAVAMPLVYVSYGATILSLPCFFPGIIYGHQMVAPDSKVAGEWFVMMVGGFSIIGFLAFVVTPLAWYQSERVAQASQSAPALQQPLDSSKSADDGGALALEHGEGLPVTACGEAALVPREAIILYVPEPSASLIALRVPLGCIHARAADLGVNHALHPYVVVEDRHSLASDLLPEHALAAVGIRGQEIRRAAPALNDAVGDAPVVHDVLQVCHDHAAWLQRHAARLLREEKALAPSGAVRVRLGGARRDVGLHAARADRLHVRRRRGREVHRQSCWILAVVPLDIGDLRELVKALFNDAAEKARSKMISLLGMPRPSCVTALLRGVSASVEK
eukprot:CAMPEP_0118857542 /NCGR_PEP_ID=MMETSP1163-20130328/4598_1 /TAXON_ID=124430 /ORGANISM="Phaeomonas parva, Strain CCMP2877" /LENGTH=545 /DNA_ID=CAMNT_0006790867 /DNA_START=36 /DNA_END=1676 /DNA_ORIENTATION=+